MSIEFDIVIRGGTIADGTGAALRQGDIGIREGRITAVGEIFGQAAEEIDARRLLVTPGFVDIHTHYDGQVTWGDTLGCSSSNGVTTVVMGNCGVGFAPCKPEDRFSLMKLMEGVEDLPEPVLAAGVPWSWESFADYLDFLEDRAFDIDIAAQVPHAALRVFVMGERALDHEPATEEDSRQMAALAAEAVKAGALGFSTSRTIAHRASDGRLTPTLGAAEQELTMIARAIGELQTGVLQGISDFDCPEEEMAMLARVCEAGGRPMSISLLQRHPKPTLWRDMLEWIAALNAVGMEVRAQVSGRPIGSLIGLELTHNPLRVSPTYSQFAELPLPQLAAHLRQNDVRKHILADMAVVAQGPDVPFDFGFDAMYRLGKVPEYEPTSALFVKTMARDRSVEAAEVVYDLLTEDDGSTLLAMPTSNYADGSLDACGEMLRNPYSLIGLGDGGAHVGFLCDSAFPTHLLSYWARDRADRLSVEEVVKKLSWETASWLGLRDRGQIAVGMRADINIIDFEKLALQPPSVLYDLPSGGRRVQQLARGYVATMVAGQIVYRDGVGTGARPGRLVRGAQVGPG